MKRIINMYQILSVLWTPEDHQADRPLLGLLIIQARWPYAFWTIQKYRRDFDTIIRACQPAGRYEMPENVFLPKAAKCELVDDVFVNIYENLVQGDDRSPEHIGTILDVMGWPIDVEAEVARAQHRNSFSKSNKTREREKENGHS